MLIALLVACSDGSSAPPAPAPSRVDAVAPAPMKADAVSAFCDRDDAPEVARTFHLPELDGAPPAKAGGWVWLNVWATWCAPCVAEMPMIRKWAGQLAAEGVPVEIRFLSVDAAAADIEKWTKSHPDGPPSMRIKDFSLVSGFLDGMGLPQSSAIPIHAFVDPSDRLRCVRTGAVNEPDYPVIKRIITGK